MIDLDGYIRFQLPLPLSTNKLHRSTRKGRRYNTPEYEGWKHEAGWRLNGMFPKPRLPAGTATFTCLIAVHPAERPDVDNHIKPLLDLLHRHSMTPDDKHCRAAGAFWADGVPLGECVVFLKAFAEGEPCPSLI